MCFCCCVTYSVGANQFIISMYIYVWLFDDYAWPNPWTELYQTTMGCWLVAIDGFGADKYESGMGHLEGHFHI